MSSRGRRKFQCRDCKATRMVHWNELNRSGAPRCTACGGMLDPYSEGAKEDRAIGDRNIRAHDDDRGDVIRARN